MKQDYLINNQTYALLRRIVTIVLPGMGVVYAVLEGVWDLPNPVPVLGVLAALTLLGGSLMGVFAGIHSNHEYDGTLFTVGNDPDTGMPHLELNITGNPIELAQKEVLYFRSVDRRSDVL